MLVENKLVVKQVNLNHQFHLCDQKTYDHYPENMRLSKEDTKVASEMITVAGKKQKIKAFLTEKIGKPVLLKTLHKIQAKMQNKDKVAPDDEIYKLHDILAEIPNANVSFIVDDEDSLVGKTTHSPFTFPCSNVVELQASSSKTNEWRTSFQNIQTFFCMTDLIK